MRLSVDGDGKANVIKNVILVPLSEFSGEMNVEIESDGSSQVEQKSIFHMLQQPLDLFFE